MKEMVAVKKTVVKVVLSINKMYEKNGPKFHLSQILQLTKVINVKNVIKIYNIMTSFFRRHRLLSINLFWCWHFATIITYNHTPSLSSTFISNCLKMEKFNFGYTIKNIPIHAEKQYKLQLIDKIEAVI